MGNCCDQKRSAWSKTIAVNQSGPVSSSYIQKGTNSLVKMSSRLKYIGNSSLTLRGKISRKIYTFNSSQVVLEIEPEDLSSIASSPLLIKVL